MDQNQEPGRDKLEGGELHVKHGKAWRWFDNFWYHYKWQIIIVAIVLIAVLVCMLSMCHRKDPDFYFYYVGQGEFSGDEQRAIISSLSKASGDDGHDADVSVTFLFLMTNDQIKRFGEEHKDDGLTVNGGLIGQNRELLSNEIMTGNAIIMFFDPEVLAETQASSDAFLPIRSYAPAGTPDEAFSGEYGVDLRYTVFADDPAFAAFPEGTVVAIRNGISALALFQREEALENRARYETLLKKWLIVD
ncbi:MAG: hypothetical protein J5958_00735 [Clostridia bacterium]|nr:hypothetical protein [Clostridia bacterium]